MIFVFFSAVEGPLLQTLADANFYSSSNAENSLPHLAKLDTVASGGLIGAWCANVSDPDPFLWVCNLSFYITKI